MLDVPELRFHHLGFAVKEPDRALRFLTSIGYSPQPMVTDPLQKVSLIWCPHKSHPPVEVIYPAGATGPLTSILTHYSSLIYHVCYETPSVELVVKSLKSAGNSISCVSTPKPAILFGNRRVSFYQINGFGLIELLESSK